MKKFKLQIGDVEIELEGATRDEAIRKAGLNPRHWQEIKGEDMAAKNPTTINEREITKVTPPKKLVNQTAKMDVEPAGFRNKSNITNADIGRWYTDGTDVWILDEVFVPEPQVSMSKVASTGGDPKKHQIKKGNLSDFKDFRRLIPEPEPKKRLNQQTPTVK